MADSQLPLPLFSKPPVSEVALSVDFAPLESLHAIQAGAYWDAIKGSYPEIEAHPEVPSFMEKFGEDFFQSIAPQIELLSSDNLRNLRHWFLNATKTELIQIQRDRFIINWRKLSGQEVYPQYEQYMRKRWITEWAQFKQFAADRKLGDFNVRQCEVAYVNDIPSGEGWEKFEDALKLFSWIDLRDRKFLSTPETIRAATSFEMPEKCGRLHVSLQHVLRKADQRQVIQLRLTARGKPKSSDDSDVLAWFDRAREWIVRGFADLTTEHAHELWGRTR